MISRYIVCPIYLGVVKNGIDVITFGIFFYYEISALPWVQLTWI
jgi:hypothetical protein